VGTTAIESVATRTLYRHTRARGGNLRFLVDRNLLDRIWRFAGPSPQAGGFCRGQRGERPADGGDADARRQGGQSDRAGRPSATMVLLAAVIAGVAGAEAVSLNHQVAVHAGARRGATMIKAAIKCVREPGWSVVRGRRKPLRTAAS
jgi:hypothetical protein